MLKKLLLFVVLSLAVGCNDYYPELKRKSDDINKECPSQFDEDTRIDSTKATNNPLTLHYYYTVTSYDKQQDELPSPIEEIKRDIQNQAQQNMDTARPMEEFRVEGVIQHYHYKDNKGRNLFDFTVKSEK